MGLHTFQGGVHPIEGKDLSKDKPIKELLPKGDLTFLMSQHIGAPAKPVVAKGDHVLRGQLLAEAGGFVSAPVFSSVSGTVKALEKHRNATGDMVDAIIVENDGQYEEVPYQETPDFHKLSKEEILKKIKDAGIVGMGGAGFPTHVKLAPKDPAKIDYIIANCAECEPYLTCDYRMMVEHPEKLVRGMEIILSLFDNAKGILAIENNKPDCLQKFSELVKDIPRITVAELQTKYPQGGERQIIHAVTGRDINSKMLPADAGCIVDNVETICAIDDAVTLGKPLMDRIFTVSGDAVTDPRNFKVLTGTSIQEILDAADGLKASAAKMISGGPMMGFAMFDLDVPVTKTTSALLCFTEDEASKYETTPCINCGRCVDACPERLLPAHLSKLSEHGDKASFEKLYGLECIECGSCSYVCPARRPLAQEIRTMKKQILVDKRKQKK
ncbi:MAG: electron transport complex subunit RsxC [Lachnospiraceae bacterium]|nr:electron transport complex subunit RsxC [Lachnospiraceae bacterium]